MRTISQQSFQQALHHAQTLANHSKTFERMARSLEERPLTRAQAAVLKDAGQRIGQHSQTMIALIEQALSGDESDRSKKYALVHQQYCEAVLLYSVAINVFVQAIKSVLP